MHQSQHPAYLLLPFGAGYLIFYETEMESDLPQLELEHGLPSVHSELTWSTQSRSCICLQETHQSQHPAYLLLPFGAGYLIFYETEMESDLPQLELEHGLAQLAG